MSVDDIFNCVRIDERTITAGQPTAEQLGDLADEGFQIVINLATIDPRYSLEDERAVCENLKMRYHHIPVAWDRPLESDYLSFTKIMQECSDDPVLIHCAANYRVTLFYSVYARKHLGWSAEQASELRDRIWTSDPNYAMDDVWSAFLAKIDS